MKSLILKITLIVALLCATSAHAQRNDQMEAVLGLSISKVKVDSVASVINVTAELKRLETMYPTEWLPTYYKTLYALLFAVQHPQDSHSAPLLKDTKTDIDKLETMKSADQSEVLTLKGFYYTGLIVQNPSVNGMLYYQKAINYYRKAIAENPDNPRPHLLLHIFNENMSKFTGRENSDAEKELQTIKELFEKEHVEGLMPSWGKEWPMILASARVMMF